MRIKNLKGHSGCLVSLHFDKQAGKKFVRKTSSGQAYNPRLQKQLEKQLSFKDATIKTPRIIDQGFNGGLFYFDMEFIKGQTLSEICLRRDIESFAGNFDTVKKYLLEEETTATITSDYSSEVYAKLKSISKNLKNNKYDRYLSQLEGLSWSGPASSSCHGDLTLENIILSGNDVYFIDFLDSFVECRLIDFSKVLQDLIYFWSWRKYERKPIVKNIRLLNEMRDNRLYAENRQVIQALMMLNMLRILPYTEDSETISYLDLCLNDISGRI